LTTPREEEQKVTAASQQLEAKLDAFRTRKETYTAAEAETHISEAVTGIPEEMSDVGRPSTAPRTRPSSPRWSAGRADGLRRPAGRHVPVAHDDPRSRLDAITAGGRMGGESRARQVVRARRRPGSARQDLANRPTGYSSASR
jgi:phage shock protein A